MSVISPQFHAMEHTYVRTADETFYNTALPKYLEKINNNNI
jgi:hypothetical protein